MSPVSSDAARDGAEPDVFFQAREACNPYYGVSPIVQDVMDRFGSALAGKYTSLTILRTADAERVVS